MGVEAILTVVIGLAGTVGGFIGGRRGVAKATVEMLEAQVATLIRQNEEKDKVISALQGKVEALEALVTQRAEVHEVYQELMEIRGVVDRIASKVDA